MDEWTLNDLLECSVCLERLDTSSKVLPCQHTFCKKCLEEIVSTKKELRCPECRVLVDTNIDDLPPNVLLMRILEGMRNAAPKRRSGGAPPVHHQRSHSQPVPGSTFAPPTSTAAPVSISHHPPMVLEGVRPQSNAKQIVLPTQLYARAIYDYVSKEPGDLSFKKGDIITLRKKVDINWYHGEFGGAHGVFPLCYVQVIPLPTHVPQCKALYDFRMTNDEEEGCLTFSKGEIITVIRRVDENWAEGRLADRVGIFPIAFVEMNGVARALMKLSTNSQPGPSRLAPPTPTSEETTPLIPTDHSRIALPQPLVHQQIQQPQSSPHQLHPQTHQTQPPQPLPQQQVQTVPPVLQQPAQALISPATLQQPHLQSDSSSSVTSSISTTPNTSGTSSNSSSSTTPSSPASPPPRPSAWSPQTRPSRSAGSASPQESGPSHQQKRHSLTALLATPTHHSSNRHSAEVLGSADITAPENSQEPPSGEFVRQGSGRHHRRSGSSELPVTNLGSIPPPLPQGIHHSLANSTNLPATYIALYPYKPQKADELELRKGGVYTVTERCQDGWFKGTSNRTQKSGVFPGNYVALAKSLPGVQAQLRSMARGSMAGNTSTPTRSASSGAVAVSVSPSPLTVASTASSVTSPSASPVSYTRERKANAVSPLSFSPRQQPPSLNSVAPPTLPPRSVSPAQNSTSWHGTSLTTNDAGRLSSGSTSPQTGGQSSPQGSPQGAVSPNTSTPCATTTPAVTPQKTSADKSKEKKERGGVSLMRRLTNMKKSKSPPPPYSMDNPVFEDGSIISAPAHPVHVRSGSCPSQLLQLPLPDAGTGSSASSSPQHVKHAQQAQPPQPQHHRLFPTPTGGSQRLRHKDRPNVVMASLAPNGRSGEPGFGATAGHFTQHRKSNSLDAGSSLSSTATNGAGQCDPNRKTKLVQPVRERFRCVVAYPPHSEYELELRVGDVIYVHRKRDDGWYKGTQQRTGRTGLFPASFVEAF